MKVFDKDGYYKFVCDRCKTVAGQDANEQIALLRARRYAKINRWIWQHPHWQLYCENCKHVVEE